jgi:hypothetical protein
MSDWSRAMTTQMRWLTVAFLAWVLWMDQTDYTISREGMSVETARSRFVQLAVLPTKQACEAVRRGRAQEAIPRDAAARRDAAKAGRGHYPEARRFFCSPAVEDSRQ